ncbi:MAG: sigma-70 family RNA polymerase sigma factor [Candidatus Thiodiazotropha endolucinida]
MVPVHYLSRAGYIISGPERYQGLIIIYITANTHPLEKRRLIQEVQLAVNCNSQNMNRNRVYAMVNVTDKSKRVVKDWFSQCIEESMGSLYAMAVRLTKNDADAEDLVAEAVSKAWSSIDTLKDKNRFRPWVFCIQRNIFIDHYRKSTKRTASMNYTNDCEAFTESEIASLLIEQPDEFLYWWANPEKEFVNNLLGEEIMQAVERLPEAFRETVILVNLEGFSYDEAAEIQGVSPGTVRSRMNRGRTLLQQLLWRQASEAGLFSNKDAKEPGT